MPCGTIMMARQAPMSSRLARRLGAMLNFSPMIFAMGARIMMAMVLLTMVPDRITEIAPMTYSQLLRPRMRWVALSTIHSIPP